MKKNIMTGYIITSVVLLSLLIYYVKGMDNSLFFITINIFVFSLTDNLKLSATMVVIATCVYILYFNHPIEGFGKKFKKKLKKRTSSVSRVIRKTTGINISPSIPLPPIGIGGSKSTSSSDKDEVVTPVVTPPDKNTNERDETRYVTDNRSRNNATRVGANSRNTAAISRALRRIGGNDVNKIDEVLIGENSKFVSNANNKPTNGKNNSTPNTGQDRVRSKRPSILSNYNRINNNAPVGESMKNPGPMDETNQIMAAYENLENLLGSEAMENMTNDSAALADKQKVLMNQMNSLAPVIDKYTQMMNGFDSSKLNDILGGLNNMMATTKVPT